MSAEDIIDLYERHAHAFDVQRGRGLQEKHWLDAFLNFIPPGGSILDLGCGMGEPIASYLLDRGYHVVGVDSSPSMINRCRTRFPHAEWVVADMREFAPGARFDGILAWDSFFHLAMDDQRAMFPRFASHAREHAALLFTSGTVEGTAVGSFQGEPLYHASLDAEEYRQLLTANGFVLRAHIADDPECGNHTVWLATYETTV